MLPEFSVILPYGGQVIFNILETDLPETKLLISQPPMEEDGCDTLQYHRLFEETRIIKVFK